MADRKANFLVTMIFDENSDIRKQVDAEIDFKDEIIKDLRHLVKGREIKHFIVADDAVINEKLNADVVERSKIDKGFREIERLVGESMREAPCSEVDYRIGLRKAMATIERNIGAEDGSEGK